MRVPIEWLADYVAIEMPIEELARRMTLAGLKIEAIEQIGGEWQDVTVGEVIEIEPHPKSNKPLHVARVTLGDRTITVVTGAQNVAKGDKAPVVLVGGLLPHGPDGDPMVIQARPMAGITSEGMLASARELGISDEHSGIYVLPPDAPVGEPLRSIMGGDVLDIETNANRPDTLSVIGIAREVAAMTEQQMTPPDLDAITGPVQVVDDESIRICVEAPDLCPRYSALRIDGVRVVPSPRWMANRLEAAGMRPINLLVDITNYVMLEYGQPMHAFDASRLQGDEIVVRRARDNERLRTLDGADRSLTRENLVIADGSRAVAIAGVMGGEESEITAETNSIVLESATFDAASVRRTALGLGLRTESSSRFEKSLPPEQTTLALQRYLQLLAQVTETPLTVHRVSDVWSSVPEERVVGVTSRQLDHLLGISVPTERAAEVLSLLGFDVSVEDGLIAANVPYWRRADIEFSVDLIEEVARIVGYETIPSTLPLHTLQPPAPPADLAWEDVVRECLLSAGASEAMTGSLTSPESMARLFRSGSNGHDPQSSELWEQVVPNPIGIKAHHAVTQPVNLVNAPTRDRGILRMTLLPSLLEVVARNLNHSEDRVALFEIARTFFRRPDDLPYERRTLAIVLSGHRRPRTWQEIEPGPYSFYDLKGMLESVLRALHVRDVEVEAGRHPALHPGRSASVRLAGRDLGWFGELHPEVADSFGIEGWPVQVAEVDLDTLFDSASTDRAFRPIPRFPAARRDVAVLVGTDVPAAEVVRIVRESGGPLLETAEIFDVYEGKQLPEDKKNVAVEMEFRAPGATLTQEEVGEIMAGIVDALTRRLGATLRE